MALLSVDIKQKVNEYIDSLQQQKEVDERFDENAVTVQLDQALPPVINVLTHPDGRASFCCGRTLWS